MARGCGIAVGAIFSTPVQTGLGAGQASFKMGTGLFLGLKRPRRDFDPPPHLVPRLRKEKTIPVLPLWTFMASSR